MTLELPVVKFAKVRETAKIPTKSEENSGFDIYADIDKDFFINPWTTRLIPTGIASEFSKNWTLLIQERGSTGSQGIKKSAGVIDSNYRGEWFVAITNPNYKTIVFSVDPEKTKERLVRVKESSMKEYHGEKFNPKKFDAESHVEKNYIIYPVTKAIAQFLVLYTPHVEPIEVKFEELTPSDRGAGNRGSSGK